jgi:predicted O-methyltransferase YrrM
MKKYTTYWNSLFTSSTIFLDKVELVLEIGSFEGLTSNYIVDNLLTENGKLICIDPLTDLYLNDNLSDLDKKRNTEDFNYFKDQYSRFTHNTKEHLDSGKIHLIRDLSCKVFPELIREYTSAFDLIYVDGDHRPESVYIDAINSLKLCKSNGYILFDDYRWCDTYVGIDKFLNEYVGSFKIIMREEQVLIQKN